MLKRVICICAIQILFISDVSFPQNQIDYVDSYWWSGYGQPAIDGDTLYLNVLNGHGIERYDISDPYTPFFIDRTYTTGFDIINFENRLFLKVKGDEVKILEFSDFYNIEQLATIVGDTIIFSGYVKLVESILFIVQVESPEYRFINSYDLSDPENPLFLGTFELRGNRGIIIGSTVAVTLEEIGLGTWERYVYDLTQPDSIFLADSTNLYAGTFDGYRLLPANGDTIAQWWYDWWPGYAGLQLIQFSPIDTAVLIESYFLGSSLYSFYKNSINSYFIYDELYSFFNLEILGKIDREDPFWFETYNNQYVIYIEPGRLKYYEATNDTTYMPLIGQYGPEHNFVLSSYLYTDNSTSNNYLLTGAESNGGELIISEIDNSGNIGTITTVPYVPAQEIIFDSVFAICLCQGNIVALLMNNPLSPSILFQLGGFNGSLVDFDKRDSLLNVITDRAYYIIDFDYINGFSVLSTLTFPANSLTSVAQARYSRSYLLKGNIGIIDVVDVSDPFNPYILLEKRLQYPVYNNLEEFDNSLWVSSEFGTDVLTASTGEPDSITFFGPEYFSDVKQIYISHDSMFVADGINGIKTFTFSSHPYSGLEYKGGYRTGNNVSHIAYWNDNFYVPDYYALWHLRWGEPTDIGNELLIDIPEKFHISQNYPNPFNASTTIKFSLIPWEKTAVQIFDILGRKVRSIEISGGQTEVAWDGADDYGEPVSSGIYFYGFRDMPSKMKKMVLLK